MGRKNEQINEEITYHTKVDYYCGNVDEDKVIVRLPDLNIKTKYREKAGQLTI